MAGNIVKGAKRAALISAFVKIETTARANKAWRGVAVAAIELSRHVGPFPDGEIPLDPGPSTSQTASKLLM